MIIIKKALVITTLFIFPHFALGATYYVDSKLGNDAWSGNLPAQAGAADGPWQTLAQVARANLLPGDSVFLRCGQVWNETLRLGMSGSLSQPIRVGAYPAPCNVKPLIDGSIAIPASAWSSGEAGAYRSSFPVNFIQNGQFDQGTAKWNSWSSDSSLNIAVDSTNCASDTGPCLVINGGTSSTLWWAASSAAFPLQAGTTYQLTLTMWVPIGKTARANIRRAESPWDTIGATTPIIGNNTWQTISLPFRTALSVRHARLDIQGTGNAGIIRLDNVSLSPAVDTPIALYVGNTAHAIAHHPNRGHDSNAPESPYFVLTSDADMVSNDNKTGSTYLPLSSDLSALTTVELLNPGVSVFVRSSGWRLERKLISGVNQGMLLLDSPTRYPLRKGYGYFFTGARWMLDEPGEWVYDILDKAIHLRPIDAAEPGTRVSVVHLPSGIDLSGRTDIELHGLAVRRVGKGIDLSRSARVAVIDCHIEETVEEGLLAAASQDNLIQNNRIINTGLDAISGMVNGVRSALRLRVLDNQIEGSAVQIQNGRIISLPRPSIAAVNTGAGATIDRNSIRDAAYHGILIGPNSSVSRNNIENACTVLHDCGGIYMYGQNHNSKIEENIIRNLNGDLHGHPDERPHTTGVYLDEPGSDIAVIGNTVENAEYGILLHNTARNLIDRNTLYGNRRYQIWFQEGTRSFDPAGDISGNIVTNNLIFPLGDAQGVVAQTTFSSTTRFASYDFNHHSALISKRIARERWNGGELEYDFIEWQSARTAGVARNLDPNGKQITQAGYTSFQVQGESVLAPINTTTSVQDGWRPWGNGSTGATTSVGACGAFPCIRMIAGATPSLLMSPNFSVEAGHWYRLTFDIKTEIDNQRVAIAPRRGGGGDNGYELFTHRMTSIYGSRNWKRHTLLIESISTIKKGDPVTGDNGARIDFYVESGKEFTIANVEIVPLQQVGATLRTALLTNPSGTESEASCPDEDPTLCGQYVSFVDGTPITWPRSVAPHSSEIIYTRDSTLIDSDGDGIADIQDQCPETPVGSAANSLGCPFLTGS
ncbi:right-handed parallel beta-helix repeat-containing protein [Nitrosovibrio sp. Nv6]|uniref:right-handed parallel beta-helix repeat-containing protein n=1 Tax=Nitrosovibrio sp. Nv6 TaxID=1855340 RepID=UPI0008ADA11C|nr:right-handed parallel beta-helix repeat-containing protein [Nitrosovibrio sp. Nv6]SEP35685.1 parallel beta-helix repeat (two copies) [Nitrosovibrio sp. Nv6]